MKNIRELLGKQRLFFDGAMGTMLLRQGLKGGILPETWNIEEPEKVLSVYKAYLQAGSHVISANTFGANGSKFDDPAPYIQAGISLAKKAIAESGREDAFVALDIGPTGKLLAPTGDLPFEDAVNLFKEMVIAGKEADCIIIETMSDGYEAKAALLAAKEVSDLPVFVTMIFDENGRLLTGGTPESVIPMLEGLHADAIGLNCGLGPVQMTGLVKRFVELSSLPILVNPNAGLPRQEGNRTVYDMTSDEFAEAMVDLAKMGIHMMGGCCGTDPEYIQKMIRSVKDLPFVPPIKKYRTWVTSYSQAVEIGNRPLIIGERINPTGKKRMKEALRNHDRTYILSQALEQESAGAHILDVNVGLPELNEVKTMKEVLTAVQEITALPLQIDTGNLEALEQALRLYNGKPMVNSVNGKLENMEGVFSLIRKYGAVVVGLCLDEDGIPSDAQGRVDIARKIVNKAAEYGLEPKDIVIDGLAMTISSQPDGALVTLETIKRAKAELHTPTILGVSNISFGLPRRENVNAHFLTMALQNGLTCAIINPNNEEMMKAYRASLALLNEDAHCQAYIEAFSHRESPVVIKEETMSLFQAIQKGLDQPAKAATKKLLQEKEGLEIIDSELIPALDVVGKGFENGTIFLPQLLMSAQAAKAAFELLRETMPKDNAAKGQVILATVQGDIHDIGKNIVKVMLENYGYDVLDLGKDVAPETIVQTAIEKDIKLVGLSALMTTTVPSMARTIALLKEKKPDAKTVVGGAVLTQEYADMIHADHYAKDAMATVRYADSVFQKEAV